MLALTQEQVQRVCVNAPSARIARILAPLNSALVLAEADTPLRAAMALAQFSHECADFLFLHELWGPTPQQKRYEPPGPLADELGNREPGDGFLYRGRGIIQITGRRNYREAGQALGLQLEDFPALAEEIPNAFKVGAWWWKKHGCNVPADKGDVEATTKIINGGFNGLMDRHMRYDRACEALGVLNLNLLSH